uniref:Trimethylguanosine synthase n=1 Tax=Globisporangium ultimum (strain ATCC 200006 / CBS 805.95 / DAOM BR144) TaxID=431595 RepID=K3WXR2_GLOUD
MATSTAPPVRANGGTATTASSDGGASDAMVHGGEGEAATGVDVGRAQTARVAVGLRPVTQQQIEGRHMQRAASAASTEKAAPERYGAAAIRDAFTGGALLSYGQEQDDSGEDEWKYVESRGKWNRTQKRLGANSTKGKATHKTTKEADLAVLPSANANGAASSSSWSSTSTSSSSSSSSSSKLSPVFQDNVLRKKTTVARGRKDRCTQQMKSGRDGTRSPPLSMAVTGNDLTFSRNTSLQKLLEKMELDEQDVVQQKAQQQQQQYQYQQQQQSRQQQQQQHSNRKRADQGASSTTEQLGAGERRVATEQMKQTQAPPAMKCGDKRDFFFRNLDFETRSQLQIDDVAGFSVTEHESATKISEAILALFTSDDKWWPENPASSVREKFPLTITDATACIGGNTISFCDYFTHVNAVECDLIRCQMLQHNLGVLKKTNIACIHASYLVVIEFLRQDVVFIDPPWGGPEYKDLAKVDLFLDDIPLYDVCRMLYGLAKVVVLKVPTNFDTEKFAQHVPGIVTVRKDLNKMHLVAIDFRSE